MSPLIIFIFIVEKKILFPEYLYQVENVLDNPVYNALLTGDAARGHGTKEVKYFDKEISPFAGFETGYQKGFEDLYKLLPPGRNILYATRDEINIPEGWKLIVHVPGLQFLHVAGEMPVQRGTMIETLEIKHLSEMLELTALTKPGPFDKRTIEFGNYCGVFENGRLAAMAGHRLHVFHFTEISAVCTHPGHLGKGYGQALLEHQINVIYKQGKTPFLHVKADNTRAIGLYERTGFKVNGPMQFYFLKRME